MEYVTGNRVFYLQTIHSVFKENRTVTFRESLISHFSGAFPSAFASFILRKMKWKLTLLCYGHCVVKSRRICGKPGSRVSASPGNRNKLKVVQVYHRLVHQTTHADSRISFQVQNDIILSLENIGDSIHSYRSSRRDSHGHVCHLDTQHLARQHMHPSRHGHRWLKLVWKAGVAAYPSAARLPCRPCCSITEKSLVESCLPLPHFWAAQDHQQLMLWLPQIVS